MSSDGFFTGSDGGLRVKVEFGTRSINDAQTILGSFPELLHKAMGSAARRAGTSARAHAAKVIRDMYVIRAASFKLFTHEKTYLTDTSGGVEAKIHFAGNHISLSHFQYGANERGQYVSARVMKGSELTRFKHAFVAQVGAGHTGIFQRRTNQRHPIRQIMGPAAPQMMNANENVQRSIEDKVIETFEKRLDHEILAIMNGWR